MAEAGAESTLLKRPREEIQGRMEEAEGAAPWGSETEALVGYKVLTKSCIL